MSVTVEAPERKIIRPQAGAQERFLGSSADIAIYGGTAGAGKTYALLLEPLRHISNPNFGAVIFRREYPQIVNEGGLWDESEMLYNYIGARPRKTTSEWIFPHPTMRNTDGAKIKFAHMQYDGDRFAWNGSQIPLIGFDQAESFTEIQFFYMLSRNRSMCGVRPYIRCTCNPVPADDEVGGWLHRFISWWIDEETGYPQWHRSGVLRWFIRVGDEMVWADTREELVEQDPKCQPKSVTFIPGKLEDNPALMEADPGYKANLMALPFVERERLLGGNWKVRPTAGNVFNRSWFNIVDCIPVEA
jgi:hypothetical protein